MWRDYRSDPNGDIYAQHLSEEVVADPAPRILFVRDVPDDEGGRIRVHFEASLADSVTGTSIARYEVWRSVSSAVATRARLARRALRTSALGPRTVYWEFAGELAAQHSPTYDFDVATEQDSTGAGNPPTLVLVEAMGADGFSSWTAPVDSGYSVDNLAPATPEIFAGSREGLSTRLRWSASSAADLSHYLLLRSAQWPIVDSSATALPVTLDTTLTDASGEPMHYRLYAVDLHGNRSAPADLEAHELAGAQLETGPLALAAPSPSPASSATQLRFALPSATHVRLAAFDVGGRRVRMLIEGTLPSGAHDLRWDLLDAAGRRVPAGLYFVRLEAAGRTFDRRLVVMR